MHTLYPSIKPYKTHEFAVDGTHRLYIEETGNPEGIPVFVFHPGPGGGGQYYLRRFFDPQSYRIIIFDQRGCGQSTPHCSIKNNTTQDLINDVEAIRDFLNIQQAILWGGGWGCLLALLYAQQYPNYVKGLLLHRIYLGRKKDINWFYQQGANLVYPDYWQEFTHLIPEDALKTIPAYYADKLQSNNELARMACAKSWALWQARCSNLQPHQNVIDQYSEPHFALALATIESHYILNQYFIDENQVLNNINAIKNIPTYLIHGRYDMICPLAGAWDLHVALPSSQLRIIRDAGHSDREAGIVDALILASKEIANHDLDAS